MYESDCGVDLPLRARAGSHGQQLRDSLPPWCFDKGVRDRTSSHHPPTLGPGGDAGCMQHAAAWRWCSHQTPAPAEVCGQGLAGEGLAGFGAREGSVQGGRTLQCRAATADAREEGVVVWHPPHRTLQHRPRLRPDIPRASGVLDVVKSSSNPHRSARPAAHFGPLPRLDCDRPPCQNGVVRQLLLLRERKRGAPCRRLREKKACNLSVHERENITTRQKKGKLLLRTDFLD